MTIVDLICKYCGYHAVGDIAKKRYIDIRDHTKICPKNPHRPKWHWQGGRLTNGKISYSISQAFELQNYDADIAAACKNVLKPNTSSTRLFITNTLHNEKRREE